MTKADNPTPLDQDDFPGLFQAADAASLQQQRSYLRATRMRLTFVVLAAVFAAIELRIGAGAIDVFAIATAIAFVSALVIELGVAVSQPNKIWYEGRALAESVKTLTWRYAVGAAPFTLNSADADADFFARLRALHNDLPNLPLLPTTTSTITDRMRSLRAAPLAERRHAYRTGRVIDQQTWYATKAEFHRRRAGFYRTAMLILETIGVAGALAKAVNVVDFDLAGIVAALVSAFAAWTVTRQHTATATAYVVASHELGIIRDLLDHEFEEEQWSSAVVDAEAAISREHTMWRASQT